MLLTKFMRGAWIVCVAMPIIFLIMKQIRRHYDRVSRELGIVDEEPWGKVRQLPDGAMQMFVRDPAGNLLELSYRGEVDQAILDEVEHGTYVSGRNDPRGTRGEDATLYHGR